MQNPNPVSGSEPETCRCGMWPIAEYGETCPSCDEPASAYSIAVADFRVAVREMCRNGFDRETIKREVDLTVDRIADETAREQFSKS